MPRALVISRKRVPLFTLGDSGQFLYWHAVTVRGLRFALGCG